jgi:hypothetical protein
MRSPLIRRSRPLDDDHEEAPATDGHPVEHGIEWTGGSALKTRAVTGGLFVTLACGPIALAVALANPSGPEPIDAAPESEGTGSLAGEYAVQVVEAWLTATQDDDSALEELFPDLPATLPATPVHVRDLAPARVEMAGEGTWQVLIGADVADPAPDSWQVSWTRRYYEVPIQVAETAYGPGLVASALPAPVAAPVRLSNDAQDQGGTLPVSGELGDSITGFLTAYLTGNGPIERYTSPQTVFTPIVPAPYAGISLTALTSHDDLDDPDEPAEGQRVSVTAEVELTRTDGETVASQYHLTLTARAGRWEVTQTAHDTTSQPDAAGMTEGDT